ncbi:hypothetical protein E2R51_08720 [Jeotgalibacillus sp. S-D1]|nr:hypothetical protein E2R51_08720 [Jeotgalibacillus sp. S-D1]
MQAFKLAQGRFGGCSFCYKALFSSTILSCTPLIGAEGARLLRDVAGEVRPLKREALKRAHPRPAESERLQRKSTASFKRQKNHFTGLLHGGMVFFYIKLLYQLPTPVCSVPPHKRGKKEFP